MRAVYYRDPSGREPVNDFVDDLRPAQQEAIDRKIEMFNRLRVEDPPLPFPHTSQVEGELRELRCHYGEELYRIIYRRSRNLFVLLHGFRKDTEAIPESEKRIARGRWDDFRGRMDATRRRPPGPGGHDAP